MKIETYNDVSGEPRYRIVADNGATVLDGAEGYASGSNLDRALGENLGNLVIALTSPEGMEVVDEDGNVRRLKISAYTGEYELSPDP